MSEEILSSTLYLISTPIGNMEDITIRALNVFRDVNLIAAEDTRKTKFLLEHYHIQKDLISYYEHNELKRIPELIEKLKSGKSIALVSDAGTPGISDPAYRLVKKAIEEGIRVVPIPGASAFLSALVVSGLPTDRFIFEGFLPHKKGRRARLENLKEETRTIVFYESPHRILRTMKDILEIIDDRNVAIARELTKKFEEIFRGKVSQAIEYFSSKQIRGEFVIVLSGKSD